MGKPRLTLDASAKVKASAVTHLKNHLAHVYRDAYERDGVQVHHSQEVRESLDTRRTSWNISLLNHRDTKTGEYKLYRMDGKKAVDYMSKCIQEKLDSLDRKVRPDDVILRPIILAIGEEYYPEGWQNFKEGTPEHKDFIEQVEKVNVEMFNFLGSKLGRENILGFSIHLDEATVQTQVTFMPTYTSEKTGKRLLGQKHFFGEGRSGKELRELHKEFRAYMTSKGYEVELESSARSTESLRGKEYGQKKDYERQQAEEDLQALFQEHRWLADDFQALSRQKEQLEEEVSSYAESLSLFDQLKERNVPFPYWLDIIHRAHNLAEVEERRLVNNYNTGRDYRYVIVERTEFTPSQVGRYLDKAIELYKADPGYRLPPNSSAEFRYRDFGTVETLDGVQVDNGGRGLSYGYGR